MYMYLQYMQNNSEKEKVYFWHIESHWRKKAGSRSLIQWYRSADPDPYKNVTDSEHRVILA